MHLIHEIRDLVKELKISLSHVPRLMNEVANSLAKMEVGMTSMFKGNTTL